MSDGSNVIYLYDGSFEGLLTAVFVSFELHEMPDDITDDEGEQMSLYPHKDIVTDSDKARRVERTILWKISDEVLYDIRRCYFSDCAHKEMLILKYICLGIKYGKRVRTMLADDTVNEMFKVVKNQSGESHFYREFLRFSEFEGVLVSVIEPKNFVLPYIASHYADRLKNESFLIYDKTHGVALIYTKWRAEIIPAEDFELPAPDEKELNYHRMWKAFYNTIGIKERYNPKCRMTHMPKRYWRCLTEFEDDYPDQPKTFEEATKYTELARAARPSLNG